MKLAEPGYRGQAGWSWTDGNFLAEADRPRASASTESGQKASIAAPLDRCR